MRRRISPFRMAFALLLLLLASHPGYAQFEFELVSDANAQPSWGVPFLFPWEGKIAFAQFTNAHGYELWLTDGTPAGTRQMCDVASGQLSAEPKIQAVLNHKLLFTAITQRYGNELWISDDAGTTATMLADCTPGFLGSGIHALAVGGGKAWFTVMHADNANDELWVTDGTPAGTRFVYHFNSLADREAIAMGIYPAGKVACIVLQEHIFGGATSYRIWRSDGTAPGTYPLGIAAATDIDYQSTKFLSTGDRFYYSGHPTPSTTSLLRTNTDATGFETVCALDTIGALNQMYFLNGAIYLSMTRFSSDDTMLWKTDGTPQGTLKVKDFPNTCGMQSPVNLVAMGGQVYFTTYSKISGFTGEQLWKTDGTSAGTQLVSQIHTALTYYRISRMGAGGGRIFFNATPSTDANELWVSDGTASGTMLLKNYPATGIFNSHLDQFTASANYVVYKSYVTDSSSTSTTLWRSDGTASGTVSILNTVSGTQSSSPMNVTRWGDRMVYACNSGDTGIEPWITDPLTGKGHMLKDLNPGSASSNPRLWTPAGNLLYFLATTSGVGEELWVTDGTAANTRMLPPYFSGSGASGVQVMRYVNGRLFLLAVGGVYCKSDTGVSLAPISSGKPVNPVTVAVVGSNILFNGSGSAGTELYTLDTQAKTVSLLKDIYPGTASSLPRILAEAPGGAFLQANDGTHGAELWYTDGTTSGTHLVKDCVPGSRSPLLMPALAQGGILYFVNYDPAYGNEPWRSDGTEAGTHMLADVVPGLSDSNPLQFYSAGGRVFFTSGHQPWVYTTDGTALGTKAVAPVAGEQWKNTPSCFAAGKRFFAYSTFNFGVSDTRLFLWESDGSGAGMQKVYHFPEITTLYHLSDGEYATDSDGRLYLALTTERGKELWRTRFPLDAKAAAGTGWPLYR